MEKKNITLSVALAVYNEASNIEACLSSVQDIADEIVVVDGGSTDETVAIAKKFGAKIIKTDNPPIFHINKQKALDACRGEWILQLDADEIVPEALKKEIIERLRITDSELKKTNNAQFAIRNQQMSQSVAGYYLPRKNYFWGHWMKKGGQYPDYVIRLVRRGKARFPCKNVHEQIAIDGEVGYLTEPLLHYAYRTTTDYWKKADAYTSLTASEFRDRGIKKSMSNWFLYTIGKPVYTFLNIFLRHKGFMDGWYGFIFAYWSALHFPIAWKKYTRKQQASMEY